MRQKQIDICFSCKHFKNIDDVVWGCTKHEIVKAEDQPCKDFIQRYDNKTAWDDMKIKHQR